MFHLIVTYREQGRQRQQTFNTDKLDAALARRTLEFAKPTVRSIELTVTIESWSKQDEAQWR